MTIGSLTGAGSNASLAQIQAKLLAALQASTQTSSDTGTTATTTASTSFSDTTSVDLVSQLQAFFQANLSSDTMGGLLQNQGPPPGEHKGPPSLSDIDSDGDGAISQSEMQSYDQSVHGNSDTSKADALFAKMDADGDGSVSADEKTAFDSQMKAHHGPHQGPPPGADQAGASGSLNDLLKQMMAALQSYQTTDSATTTASTSLVSTAA